MSQTTPSRYYLSDYLSDDSLERILNRRKLAMERLAGEAQPRWNAHLRFPAFDNAHEFADVMECYVRLAADDFLTHAQELAENPDKMDILKREVWDVAASRAVDLYREERNRRFPNFWLEKFDTHLLRVQIDRRLKQILQSFGDDATAVSTLAENNESTSTPTPTGAEALLESPTPPAPAATEPKDIKAERRKLLVDYKAECKLSGQPVTYETIARGANQRWKSRTQIDKWIACDPRYNGEHDRLLRDFLTRETQRLREMRLKKPCR